MIPLRQKIFKEINEVEEISVNAFLTAWGDYFQDYDFNLLTDIDFDNFKKWLLE